MPTVNSKLTTYSANLILNTMLDTRSGTSPTTFSGQIYLGLSNGSTDPGNDGTFTEVTGEKYSRILIGNTYNSSATSYEKALHTYFAYYSGDDGKYFTNTREIYFKKMPETASSEEHPWGVIKYVGLFDAATGGNLLWWGQIDPTITTLGDHIVMLERNAIKVYIDDWYTPSST